MNPSANVQNVDYLAMFQMSLQHFQEKAKDALMNIDMDLRRTKDWLDDMYSEWKAEIRKAENALPIRPTRKNASRNVWRVWNTPRKSWSGPSTGNARCRKRY